MLKTIIVDSSRAHSCKGVFCEDRNMKGWRCIGTELLYTNEAKDVLELDF